MTGNSNAFSPAKRRAVLLVLLGCVLFAFHFCVASRRMASQFDGDHDFTSYATLGRSLIEFRWLPTFIFPGKTFDGPVKQFIDFSPGVFLGYHEWLPLCMIALTATGICLLCCGIARVLAGREAGVIALFLCGAMDPYVAVYAFRHAYTFDVMVLLGLCLGFLVLLWGQRVRCRDSQPGLWFCLVVGVVAGLSFYAHPTGAAAVLSAALFLFLCLGGRVFTWRVPVTGLGFFLGSAPFWIYWIRYGGVLDSWIGYAGRYDNPFDGGKFLFSWEGYLGFLLTPSGHLWRGVVTAFILIAVLGVGFRRVAHWFRASRSMTMRTFWRKGLRLPGSGYVVLVMLCMGVVILSSSGMSQASGGWAYGVELWFWLTIAVACALAWLVRKYRRIGVLVVLMMGCCAYADTIYALSKLGQERRQAWLDVKADAGDLAAGGHDKVLTVDHADYIFFALGQDRVDVSAVHDPWVLPLARAVERAPQVAVMGRLVAATHGPGAWESRTLRTTTVHHSFRVPPAGVVLSNAFWEVKGAAGGWEALRDNSFSTFWHSGGGQERLDPFVLQLDHAREICRLVLLSSREGDDWRSTSSLRNVLIEGQRVSGEWIVLADGVDDDGFHWDGQRLFYDVRERNRVDIRFGAESVVALRLQDRGVEDREVRRITELYLFEKQDKQPGEVSTDALLRLIKASGARRILASRSVSALVREAMPGVQTWIPAAFQGPVMRLDRDEWPWFTGYERVAIPGTMVVAEAAFAPRIDALLSEDGIVAERAIFGGLVVWRLRVNSDDVLGVDLVWNGVCLGRVVNKRAAAWQLARVKHLGEAGSKEQALLDVTRALRMNPAYYDAAVFMRTLGAVPPGQQWQSGVPPVTRFRHALHFGAIASLKAIEVSAPVVKRGEEVELRLTWSIPDAWKYVYRRPTVFCHIRNGEYRLGDDHSLLGEIEHRFLRESLPGELFVERRTITIPADAPPGPYDLDVGLHFAMKRVPVRTADKTIRIRRDAARLSLFRVE